jgi:Tol biopolymer transport system component
MHETAIYSESAGTLSHATITPDGTAVYFEVGSLGLYEYTIATGALKLIQSNPSPDLSPVFGELNISVSSDSRYVIWTANPNQTPANEVFILDRQTGEVNSSAPLTPADVVDNLADSFISSNEHYFSLAIDEYNGAGNAYEQELLDLRPPTLFFGPNNFNTINLAQKTSVASAGLTFSGASTNVEPGNTVEITLGGEITASGVVQADGAWTVTFGKALAADLTDGSQQFTATVLDNGGTSASASLNVLVDTTPPSEVVDALAVAGDNVITTAEELSSRTVEVTGALSAPLAPGDQVEVVLAGTTYAATAGSDGTSFSAEVATPLRYGAVQAYVQDAVGNPNAPDTQFFTRDAVSTQISTGPNGPGDAPALFGIQVVGAAVISADGRHVAFETASDNLAPGMSGVSLVEKDLLTGTVTLIATGQELSYSVTNYYAPSIDADGGEVAYVAGSEVKVYTAGQGSADVGTNADDNAVNYYNGQMNLSADGGTLTYNGPVGVVRAADGTYSYAPFDYYGGGKYGNTIEGVIEASNGLSGWTTSVAVPVFMINNAYNGFDGYLTSVAGGTQVAYEVEYAGITPNKAYFAPPNGSGVELPNDGIYDTDLDGVSADGNIFLLSTAGNILPGFDAHGVTQVYEYNKTDDTVTLVSAGANGPANGATSDASMSADGRYVVFSSSLATNLSPETVAFSNVYVKDVQTGALQWVAGGAVSGQAISDDGRFVTYSSGGQVYVADLQAPLIGITSGATINSAQKDVDDQNGFVIFGRTTVDDGTLVTVTLNGQTYLATASGGGWSVTVPAGDATALTDQTYVVTASTTDDADRAANATQSLLIKTIPPAAPLLNGLASGSDSGVSPTDGLTNIATPTVAGTAEKGATVTLYDTDGHTVLGTGVADANTGAFQIATTALANGPHEITAIAVDAAGNVSAVSGELPVTIELAAAPGSITPDPTASPTATSVTFDVNLGFAAPLTASEFAVTATGSAAGVIQTISGSGTEYYITISGISGTGTLGLAPATNAQITDAAGNAETFTTSAHGVAVPRAPVVTGISAESLNGATQIGAGDTVTIDLSVDEALTVTGAPVLDLSNGATALYSRSFTTGGFPFGPITNYVEFTYTPALGDAGGPLSITGLDTSQGAIVDSANDPLAGPFNQSLGLTVQTAPLLSGDFARLSSGSFVNSGAVTVYGSANIDQAGEYVTIFDGSSIVGSEALGYSGSPSASFFELTTTTLAEGQHSLTAVISVGPYSSSGDQSLPSAALAVEVDTTPPSETVTGLTLGGDDHLSLAEQAANSLSADITLSAPLAPGAGGEPQDAIEITLPDGLVVPATLTAEDGSGEKFSVDLSSYISQFGVDGSISAYVVDGAGNQSATLTTDFTAATQRVITPVSATPASFSLSTGQLPSLSGNGEIVAFQVGTGGGYGDFEAAFSASSGGDGGSGGSVTPGIYIEDLLAGATSLTSAAPGGLDPSLSYDGQSLAYIGQDNGSYALYIKSLDSQSASDPGTLVSPVGDYGFDRPSLSADASTVAFTSLSSDIAPGVATTDEQVYVATLSGGQVSIVVASAPDPHGKNGAADTSQGTGGESSAPSLAANGGSVAFVSEADNLLGQDPRATTLKTYVAQIYVKTLVDNAATGLKAGAVTLVSAARGGNAVGDGYSSSPSISGDGRYVVFASSADNLAPDNLTPGASIPQYTQEIYVDDLKTGEIKLVSQTQSGAVADGYSFDPTISADGGTVLFSSSADNLAGASGDQIYAWNRATGAVTLLSEPGAIPGNASSQDPSVSSDGSTVAFDSSATNLAPGEGSSSPYGGGLHTFVTSVPAANAKNLVVTNANDSGAGSLRAELGLAADGDTITFDPALAGKTIDLNSTLTIADGVTLDGTGANITISGQGEVTDFKVDDRSTLPATIEGLAITDGNGQGAAGLDSLAGLDNPGDGGNAVGGIDIQRGSLSLAGDSFSGNSATGGVGGKNNGKGAGGSAGAAAGAIYAESGTTLSASNLTFTGNKATAGLPGDVTNIKGAGTQGAAAAGAIYVDSHSIFTIENSTFDDNSATGGWGGFGGEPVSSGSDEPAAGGGEAAGGIYVAGHSTVDASALAFSGNIAKAGLDTFGDTHADVKAYADSNITGLTGPVSAGGTAQDGYIAGGTVAYENGSAPSVTTGSDGSFDLIGGSGPIELTGGTDSGTGLAFTGEYEAPAGSTVLSPLTTLLEAVVVAQGDASASGVAAAQKLVETAFNLPTNIDLTSYDAEGALLGAAPGSPALATAEKVFAADSYLQGVESLIGAAGGSGSAPITAVAAELAAGQSVDLTDPATLIDLGGLLSGAAAAVLKMTNATVDAVSTQLSNTTDPKTEFIDVTGGDIAAQVNGVDGLSQANGDYAGAATNYVDTIGGADPSDDPILTGDSTALDNYEQAACYRKGTLILTTRGEIAVENLAIGDFVITASGTSRPVQWLGHRKLNCARHPHPREVWPVCVSASAFGASLPRRDLWLSPGHNIALEGALMPISALLNGRSVCQVPAPTIEYWHVELDEHDVILAEGLPAESYLDTGNRTGFVNGGAYVEAHPDFKPKHWAETCLPLVFEGPEITRAKTALLSRLRDLGHFTTREADSHVMADGERIEPIPLGVSRLAFALPPDRREIALVSRAFVPAHAFADSADGRTLGLCVGKLQIDGEDIALGDESLPDAGWHDLEDGQRWTRGVAPLPPGTRLVMIDLAGPGHYWREADPSSNLHGASAPHMRSSVLIARRSSIAR